MDLGEPTKSNNFKDLERKYEDFIYIIADKNKSSKVPMEILLHEGRVGLYKAHIKYKQNRNTAFSTFAYTKIENEIKEIKREYYRIISVPRSITSLSKKIDKIIYEIAPSKNIVPYAEFLAEELDEELNDIKSALLYLAINHRTIIEGQKDDVDPIESVTQTTFKAVEDIFDLNNISRVVIQGLSSLKERDREIVMHYFSISPHKKMSQKELSEKFKVSQSRISEILNQALSELKKEKKLKELYDEIE